MFTKIVNELQFEIGIIVGDVFTASESILRGRQEHAEQKYQEARQKLEFILAKMNEFEAESKFVSERE